MRWFERRTSQSLALAAALLLTALSSVGVAEAQPYNPPFNSGVDAAKPPGYPVVPGIWKLHGQDPNLPTDDLEPLRRMIGRSSVVAFGESVHASGGFYDTKHRMFRFLVEKMGFRVFVIESSWSGAEDVERYIHTSCEGSPERTLDRHHGVWASTEMADFVQWMCEWNRNHPRPADKIHYYGYDIQQSNIDAPALTAFLTRTGTPEDHPWFPALQDCNYVRQNFPREEYPEELYGRCMQALREIEGHFRSNERSLRAQTSRYDFEIARLRVVGMLAHQEMAFVLHRNFAAGFTARDLGMAYAFHKLRELHFPRSKVMIWASDMHVAKSVLPDGSHPVGSHLAKALKRDYLSFSLSAYETEYDILGTDCGPIERKPGSVDERLNELGPDTLLVDTAFPGTRRPYLPGGLLTIGVLEWELKRHFNGVIWMRHSPRMHPLWWPACK
ncbi:MAG TPA: erythromycin esterase family protein [Thermoanaerobaculia bacterium]|nr:erythromycin esterase family protein [Thermoanaerobaculia bacterium]